MSTPDPKPVDVSTSGQKATQAQLEPFIQNLFQSATNGGLMNPANNPFARALQTNPSLTAFNQANPALMDIISGGDFNTYEQTATPIWQRNLQFAQGGLNAAAPLATSSALATQGIDLTGRATQDYNLFLQEAWRNFVQDRINAANVLGTLGAQASSAEIQGAINPTVALLTGGMQYAAPQNVAVQRGGVLDYLIEAGKIAAMAIPG